MNIGKIVILFTSGILADPKWTSQGHLKTAKINFRLETQPSVCRDHDPRQEHG
mgnify:CR=1 FL=1